MHRGFESCSRFGDLPVRGGAGGCGVGEGFWLRGGGGGGCGFGRGGGQWDSWWGGVAEGGVGGGGGHDGLRLGRGVVTDIYACMYSIYC